MACSPDFVALVLIDTNVLNFGGINNQIYLASVEHNTGVSSSIIGIVLLSSRFDIIICELGDDIFKKYIPKEHFEQIIHHLYTLSVNYDIYVSASEVGLMKPVCFITSSN